MAKTQESNIRIEEVDAALCEIDRKYQSESSNNGSKNCSSQLVKKLFEEFDCLGITESKDVSPKLDRQMQLVLRSLHLINVHRKVVAQLKENNVTLAALKASNLQLEKKLDSCKKNVTHRDDTINAVHRKLVLLKLECDDLKTDKLKLQQELECYRKCSNAKTKEFEHKLNKLQYDNLTLKDSIEKNAGIFKSKDDIVADLICKYRMNEEVYNDTIRQLQENNRGLISEILNLKEEVLIAMSDKQTIS